MLPKTLEGSVDIPRTPHNNQTTDLVAWANTSLAAPCSKMTKWSLLSNYHAGEISQKTTEWAMAAAWEHKVTWRDKCLTTST